MKKRVLIFDDDEAIPEVCAIVLETNGFDIEKPFDLDNLIMVLHRAIRIED